jgi:hypothetical protein
MADEPEGINGQCTASQDRRARAECVADVLFDPSANKDKLMSFVGNAIAPPPNAEMMISAAAVVVVAALTPAAVAQAQSSQTSAAATPPVGRHEPHAVRHNLLRHDRCRIALPNTRRAE